MPVSMIFTIRATNFNETKSHRCDGTLFTKQFPDLALALHTKHELTGCNNLAKRRNVFKHLAIVCQII